MTERPIKHIAKLSFVIFMVLILSQACQQRYWFRKKAGDSQSSDSGEVDTDYKIIW